MSGRLLEDFAEISTDWFWEMDENLRFSYFSERWQVIFGRSPDPEIGKSRLELASNSEDKAFWQSHIEDLLARRPFRDLIYPYRFEDGHICWLKVSGRPLTDGNGRFAGYRGVGTDFTGEYEAKRRLSETLDELQQANCALQHQNGRLKEQERELSTQASQMIATLDNMRQGLIMLDVDFRLIVWNSRFAELLGVPPGKLRAGGTSRDLFQMAFDLGHFVGQSFEPTYERWLRRLSRREGSVHKQLLADGRVLSVTYVPMADTGWVITYEDITECERAEAALREQRYQLDAALNNMAQGLCMFDSEHRVLVHNTRYLEIFGMSSDAVYPGINLRELLQCSIDVGNLVGSSNELYQEYLANLKQRGSLSIQRAHLDGRTIAINHRPMPNGGWVATYEDVTEQKLAQARIIQLAKHDPLTDLPNRALFGEKMEEALTRVRRGEKLAVLCVDLDHFKAVNDTLGHAAGDILLKIVTDRLKECLRETDTVARLGGDEFAILSPGLDQPEQVAVIAERIITSLTAPYILNGHDIFIGASIGVAFAPGDADDANTLLKNADMALYRAKASGRGTYSFFVPEMNASVQHRHKLEFDLRRALAADEFELYYQPFLDIQTNEITGFEALLRWNHPERGLVSPMEFIPFAEEIGLIVPIGKWVIRTACAEASKWPRHVRLAVNLSPVQFRSRALVHDITAALGSSGLSPRRLEIEITESVLLNNTEATLVTLHSLRELGVRVAMDDFGTGYSSLSYLRSFPFDRLKIDRSFVQDLGSKDDCMAIVKAVAGLGAGLGMATTAEGVETIEQLRHVKEQGCTEVQGYLLGIPKSAKETATLLRQDPRGSSEGRRTG